MNANKTRRANVVDNNIEEEIFCKNPLSDEASGTESHIGFDSLLLGGSLRVAHTLYFIFGDSHQILALRIPIAVGSVAYAVSGQSVDLLGSRIFTVSTNNAYWVFTVLYSNEVEAFVPNISVVGKEVLVLIA